MSDVIRRLLQTEEKMAAELVSRGILDKRAAVELVGTARAANRNLLTETAYQYARAGRRITTYPWFVPGLAWADRQVAIQAVVTGALSDRELIQLQNLLNLQTGGKSLARLKAAVETETERRRTNGKRGGRNRASAKRG